MESLIQVFFLYHQTVYTQCAALTCIVCDILAHLQDEVELIWWKKWGVVKILYILARYFGLFYNLSHLLVYSLPVSYEFCKNTFYPYSSIAGAVGAHLLINSIFLLRMYALYGCTRRALVFWATFVLAMLGFQSYGGVWSAVRASGYALPPPFPGWKGCLTAPVEYHTGVLFASVPAVIEGLVYFVVTARKLKKHTTEYPTKSSTEVKSAQKSSPLSTVLFQDGAFWFLAITVLCSVLTWAAIYEKGLYILHITPWIETVFSCAAAHVVLNLRRTGARQEEGSARSRGHSVWTKPIDFAQRPVTSSSTVHTGESSTPFDSFRDLEGNSVEKR